MTARDAAERVLAETAKDWAAWLAEHHTQPTGVWLVTWRPDRGHPVLGYEESVVEALRYGWIDSSGKGEPDQRLMWFAPRRPGSGWARTNKQRIEQLEREGRMEPAGHRVIEAARADGSWTLLDDVEDLVVPPDLAAEFETNPGAREHWDAFPKSARRAILEWITQAKRPETRSRRITQTAAEAARGRRANEWVPRDQR